MLDVTIFHRPDGKSEVATVHNIRSSDAQFFRDGEYDVSMEELTTGQFVIYAAHCSDEEGEQELLYLVPEGELCEDAFSKLRRMVEEANKS